MEIQSKRILITGGAKRCGAAMAEHFAGKGAVIALHCNTSTAEAQALLERLPGKGHQLFTADFSAPEQPDTLIKELGNIDIIINNASLFFRPGSKEDLDGAELYDKVNFRAPEKLLNYFASQNLPDGGCAVNMVDQAVFGRDDGAYTVSRKRLTELTLRMAKEYGTNNLRFNAVAPGPVLPPAWAPDSKMAKTLPTLSLKRPVAVQDIVAAVDFLISCDSATGVILPVDCGQRLSRLEGCLQF